MSESLHTAYETALRNFHAEISRAGAITCIVLLLMGVGLDYSLYPDRQLEFGIARGIFSLIVVCIILVMRTKWAENRVPWLTFAWLMQPQIMIAWMIATTEGADSIYYAGLTLGMYASGIILAFGIWKNLLFGAASLVLYIGACTLHQGSLAMHGAFHVHTLLLTMAAIISAVYTYFNERARFALFRLRAQVDEKSAQLERTNRSLATIKGQLLQQEKMAAVGTLTSGLLHEINNPVNYCLMAMNLALARPGTRTDAALAEYLEDAREGMQRIQHIVSDLKTFAYRPHEADTSETDFPLARAIDTALRMSAHEIGDVEVVRDLPAHTLVRGDEAGIIGVLINLLSNAASAQRSAQTPHPKIVISAQWSGGRLHVKVEDNGPGIVPDDLNRVFEPFFTTRDIGQGLGLGLSISYGIIERHGGRLAAESERGEGTRMRFDLSPAAA